jgi:transposase-like protein
MTTKNPYRKWAKHDRQKTIWIIKLFCEDITANKTSNLLQIERNTINNRYNYFREVIYRHCENERKEVWNWIFELDESYFWPTRVRWKRWRWAWMKTIVFGLLKRNWKVYTEIVPNCKANTLRKIIRWKIEPDSEINTDWRRWYNWLVDIWYDKHYRVHHGKNEFVRWNQHVNWIESFWSFTKRRLNKFNGVTKRKFPLHLKESEFRFNTRIQNKNIYNELKKILKEYVKNNC